MGSSRTTAFGVPTRSNAEIRGSLHDAIEMAVRLTHTWPQVKPERRDKLLQKTRTSLVNATSMQVATQPLVVKKKGKPSMNPIWENIAPSGAYRKAKRFCGLITDISLFLRYRKNKEKIHRILYRMTKVIWKISNRDFDGMCRHIRSLLTYPFRGKGKNQILSPETPKLFEKLIGNPFITERVKRFTRNRTCQHKAGYTAMRFSYNVVVATWSLLCTKCKTT